MIIQRTSVAQHSKPIIELPHSRPLVATQAANPAVTVAISQAAQDALAASNTNSRVSGSWSGTTSSRNDLRIAQMQEGLNHLRAAALRSPSASWTADFAYSLAHDNSMIGSAIGGLVELGATPNDPVTYVGGAPVTVASQAYFTQQATSYRGQVLQLYNTEMAKGTTAGQIVNDIFDLQAKQPAAFRAMMMWLPATEPLSIQAATNIPGTTPQYLNAGGQVVNS